MLADIAISLVITAVECHHVLKVAIIEANVEKVEKMKA